MEIDDGVAFVEVGVREVAGGAWRDANFAGGTLGGEVVDKDGFSSKEAPEPAFEFGLHDKMAVHGGHGGSLDFEGLVGGDFDIEKAVIGAPFDGELEVVFAFRSAAHARSGVGCGRSLPGGGSLGRLALSDDGLLGWAGIIVGIDLGDSTKWSPIFHAPGPDEGVRADLFGGGEVLEFRLIDGTSLFVVDDVIPAHDLSWG